MAVLAIELSVTLTVEPASEAVAVLAQAKVWTVAVPFDSESSSVHPAGPVTVGLTELTVATRTITSPSSTDAGTVTVGAVLLTLVAATAPNSDRKSTRLNSSHVKISYAVFCLKKKKKTYNMR